MDGQSLLSDPLIAGLASAYFLASFLFAGYVLKVYVELRRLLTDLETRLDRFKYLESYVRRQWDRALADMVPEDEDA